MENPSHTAARPIFRHAHLTGATLIQAVAAGRIRLSPSPSHDRSSMLAACELVHSGFPLPMGVLNADSDGILRPITRHGPVNSIGLALTSGSEVSYHLTEGTFSFRSPSEGRVLLSSLYDLDVSRASDVLVALRQRLIGVTIVAAVTMMSASELINYKRGLSQLTGWYRA